MIDLLRSQNELSIDVATPIRKTIPREHMQNASTDAFTVGTATGEVTPTRFAMEAMGWGAVYTLVILHGLVPTLRSRLSRHAFWDEMLARKGQVLTSMAEESVLTLSLSCHHIFGGLLMLWGQMLGRPEMWLHGLLVEVGFEVVDIICLLMNAWPYPIVQPRLKIITIFHHLPGLVAAPSLIMAGFHHNEHLQAIGWSLLLAGGVSLLTDGIKQTRSMDTQLGQWLALHVINLTGVLAARFVVFPLASFSLLTGMSETHPSLVKLAAFGVGSMALFNLAVVVILCEKLVRYGSMWARGMPAGKASGAAAVKIE